MNLKQIEEYWANPKSLKILEHWSRGNHYANGLKYLDTDGCKLFWKNVYLRQEDGTEIKYDGSGNEDYLHYIVEEIKVEDKVNKLIVKRIAPSESREVVWIISHHLWAIYDMNFRLLQTATEHEEWYGSHATYVQEKAGEALTSYFETMKWLCKLGTKNESN